MAIGELLAATPLFGRFDEAALASVAEASAEKSLARGDVLFHQQDEASELYVVRDGRIAIANRDRDELTLPVTQEELAAMVGASRERVNKALATFVRLRWLEQRERHYVILNREELTRRAQ